MTNKQFAGWLILQKKKKNMLGVFYFFGYDMIEKFNDLYTKTVIYQLAGFWIFYGEIYFLCDFLMDEEKTLTYYSSRIIYENLQESKVFWPIAKENTVK